jgi:hypothetical protein
VKTISEKPISFVYLQVNTANKVRREKLEWTVLAEPPVRKELPGTMDHRISRDYQVLKGIKEMPENRMNNVLQERLVSLEHMVIQVKEDLKVLTEKPERPVRLEFPGKRPKRILRCSYVPNQYVAAVILLKYTPLLLKNCTPLM